MLRIPFAVGLCAALIFALAVSAEAGEAKKKKKNKGVSGVVVDVTKAENGKDKLGQLTIKTHGKKGAEGMEVKIDIPADVKVEKIVGKKGQKETLEATFADLKVGQRLTVQMREGQAQAADRVSIVARKKKGA